MSAENVSTIKQVELTEVQMTLICAAISLCSIVFTGGHMDDKERRMVQILYSNADEVDKIVDILEKAVK